MKPLFDRWPSLVSLAMVLAVCGTLLGSLSYQFILGELPCPLCVIQRLCFLLACIGPVAILFDDGTRADARVFQSRQFALTLFASLLGAAASIRQILLHIVPPDPGYGPPVLGLHLYTWALVVFACLILGSGIGLLGVGDETRALWKPLRLGTVGLFTVIAVVLVVATIVMQGFTPLLPDDPEHYELLRQIGLVG